MPTPPRAAGRAAHAAQGAGAPPPALRCCRQLRQHHRPFDAGDDDTGHLVQRPVGADLAAPHAPGEDAREQAMPALHRCAARVAAGPGWAWSDSIAAFMIGQPPSSGMADMSLPVVVGVQKRQQVIARMLAPLQSRRQSGRAPRRRQDRALQKRALRGWRSGGSRPPFWMPVAPITADSGAARKPCRFISRALRRMISARVRSPLVARGSVAGVAAWKDTDRYLSP